MKNRSQYKEMPKLQQNFGQICKPQQATKNLYAVMRPRDVKAGLCNIVDLRAVDVPKRSQAPRISLHVYTISLAQDGCWWPVLVTHKHSRHKQRSDRFNLFQAKGFPRVSHFSRHRQTQLIRAYQPKQNIYSLAIYYLYFH